MNIYSRKQRWKLFLLAAALLIGLTSLWYTNNLVSKLAEQEHIKVELWAKAISHLSDVSLQAGDLTFALDVLQSNNTIPVLLTDSNYQVKTSINVDSIHLSDPKWVKNLINEMRSQHDSIVVRYDPVNYDLIFYKDSILLNQLRYYPFFQLAVISLFLIVSYLAFSSSRKAEQNQVWVGMAKETAHQLGTPLSSLLAWVELLKMKNKSAEHITEIEKDISRLETITERFSKIGSAPVLNREDVKVVTEHSMNYIRSRASSLIQFSLQSVPNHSHLVMAPLNIHLFEWVLENIFKNAIDAMQGQGKIDVLITDQQQFVYIDITDSGCGIPKSKFKTIFKPGFTSKERGWGLGLSLSKRIIEEYHKGQIFVKASELNKGTTIRIVLNKQIRNI
ncbi:MAG: sensor histidine kinase [Bacteroidia bacterium]|nr:sensor histidine kinase [Bacteroidia bacterium]MCZ2278098.1 sensor histidine kinase [Bacteroidia bacterium]